MRMSIRSWVTEWKGLTTICFSLEAEQDSGSDPRCQDTILGDVNAQTRFKITSIQSIIQPLQEGYTLGVGGCMKTIGIEGTLLHNFLLLVYFNAAKLMLMLLGSVNAARLMLMLPV
ncbi:hypothetical protein Tco_0374022 [Tanacetum coccineum]